MNTLSLMVIVLLLTVILVLLIVVISILNKSNKSKKERVKTDFNNNDLKSSLPSIKAVQLPASIEKLASDELYFIVKKIYESYGYLDYKNMNVEDLEKKEWHTWQVSLLLKVYKMGDDYYIGNKDEVFHNSLLKASEEKINSKMDAIIKHYVNFVDIHASKDKLSKEYIWSSMDVSVIFYFLSSYKDYYR